MITNYQFGEFVINGKKYKDDITIIDGMVGRWDRDEHVLYVDNVEELVESKPEYIVIGTGAYGALDVPADVRNYIEDNRIKLIIEKTEKACSEFNRLEREHVRVAGLFHATC